MVLGYVGGDNRKGTKEYGKFLKWGIEKEMKNPLDIGKGSGVVGCEDFVQGIKEKYLKRQKGTREQPALRELRKLFKPQELIDLFARLTGKEKEEICIRGKNSNERAMLMEFLYRFCRITQPEIGKLMGGIDYSAVSRSRIRLQKKLERNYELRAQFDNINDQIIKLSRVKI
jgi:hypothetical protein